MPALSVYPENRVPRGLSHRTPLLFPGFLALLGATYPRGSLKCLATAAVLAFLVGTLWFLSGVRHARSKRRSFERSLLAPVPPAVSLLLSAVCLIMGISRGLMWDRRILTVKEVARPGVSVHLTVIPLEEPRPEANGSRYSFRAIVRSPEFSRAGWFGVEASAYPPDVLKIIPGFPVDCRAALEVPPPAMNPGGFDYRGYLLGERVVALARMERVSEPEGPSEGALRHSLLPLAIKTVTALRSYMARAIDVSFPGEDAALLKAVFLGDRGELSPEDSRDFRRSGFYRFVGICGFHVDLMFGLIERGLRRVTKRPFLSRTAAILVAFSYGCLSGWPAGVLRAFVSGLLKSMAPPARRRYHSLAGLGASALVVAWAIPFPFKNTGFLLSFAGALGAWLGRVYAEAAGQWIRSPRPGSARPNRESVNAFGLAGRYLQPAECRQERPSVPSSVWACPEIRRLAITVLRPLTICLVLLPVMASCFHEVSLVSFVLSGVWGSLAAFVVPVAAATTFIPPVGALFGWVPHILLRGVRAVARVAARMPLASVTVPAPGALEIVASWAILAAPLASDAILGRVQVGEDAAVFFRRNRLRRMLRRAAIPVSVVLMLLSAVFRAYALFPEVTFLYVGQGDCAVVRCGSSVMIVDTGTASAFDRNVLPYLKAKGVRHVDMCVVSHLHADHAGGLPALCSEMSVGVVAVTPGFREEAEALIAGSGTLPQSRMPHVVELNAGYRYKWSRAVLDVLLPEPGSYGTREPQNESSVAFILNLGNMEVEFWGDSPSSSISEAFKTYGTVLEGRQGLSQRVVKVPHHGSPDAYVETLYLRTRGGVTMQESLRKDVPSGALSGDGQTLDVISIVSVGPNSYGHPSKLVEEAARKGGKLLRLDETGAVTVKGAFGKVVTSTFLQEAGRRSGLSGRKPERSHLETSSGGPE